MGNTGRLINLRDILNIQYQMGLKTLKELGEAKAMSDAINAGRYEHHYNKKSEELEMLEKQLCIIEKRLKEADYSIDIEIQKIESIYLKDTIYLLSEWKIIHKELHEVLETTMAVSQNLTLLRRNLSHFDEKALLDLHQDWEKGDRLLKNSCVTMENLEKLKNNVAVQNYQRVIKKNRDEFAQLLFDIQLPSMDSANGKVKEKITRLKNICSQFQNEIFTSMNVADKQIIRIVESLQLHIKSKGEIE